MRPGGAGRLAGAAEDGGAGVSAGRMDAGSRPSLTAQDVVWMQMTADPPWNFVLTAAGMTAEDDGLWSQLGSGRQYKLHGRSFASYLARQDGSGPFLGCPQVWTQMVHGGDRDAAAVEFIRYVREQGSGVAEHGLPEPLVTGIIKAWRDAGLIGVDIQANRVSATLVAPDEAPAGSAGADTTDGRLLTLIRDVFEQTGQSRLFSGELIEALKQSQAAGTEHLTSQLLASMLARYGIAPYAFRREAQNRRGYDRAAFVDTWARYLP